MSLGSRNVSDSRIPYFSCILFTIWHTDHTHVYRRVIFANSSDVMFLNLCTRYYAVFLRYLSLVINEDAFALVVLLMFCSLNY